MDHRSGVIRVSVSSGSWVVLFAMLISFQSNLTALITFIFAL